MKKALLLIALFLSSPLSAHTIWLEKDKSLKMPTYSVKFGHESTETYPEYKLHSIHLLDKSGHLTPTQPYFQQGEAHFSSEAAIIAFTTFDNGVWSKLPSGKWVEKNKKEAQNAEVSIKPLKINKAILNWAALATQPHNQPFELIPQAQPEVGKPLAILVLKNGKPAQGIKVGLGEDQPFELTNEQGIAYYTPIAGFNKVWAEFEGKGSDEPDSYDEWSVEYTLTFEGLVK